MKQKKLIGLITIIILGVICASGCIGDSYHNSNSINSSNTSIQENGTYNSKDTVCKYIEKFHKLPNNYLNKSEAKGIGWSGGSLDKYAPGKSIGGDKFTNRQEILPTGHSYIECDIDTEGKESRGAKRIVYSTDDYKVYYTSDHYKTFTLIN